MRIVIVGRGRVGRGLARALEATALEWILAGGRDCRREDFAAADLVVLAVPDGAITECAARIAPWLQCGACVLHCAGARSRSELAACSEAGLAVGIMHPLASFADALRSPALPGSTFVIAGDERAVRAAAELATALGAVPLIAPLHGPAYHALAALVANGTVGLVHAAVPVLEQLGLTRPQAELALAGLLRTVADNVRELGVPRALTGPVMRGDATTVAAHKDALQVVSPNAAAAYRALAPLVLRCALANGLPDASARAVAEALGVEFPPA